MDTLNLIILAAGLALGLHLFARLLERSDRRHRRELRQKAIREARVVERDLQAWEHNRARDRAQPEAVDALVIRHLRG